jgi:GINS complex subunit 4
MDNDTYNNTTNNINNTTNPKQTLNLKLSILQTDLSRTQYLIRSYLRQRLSKITKFAMHYLVLISSSSSSPSTQQTNSTDTATRTEDTLPNISSSISTAPLSPLEAQFLHSHQYLLASHYRLSFLASFPPQLRRLDDNAGGTSMIQGPDTKELVFVRVLVPEVTLLVPADETFPDDAFGTTMRMGEVWAGRWEGVRKAWERGDVEVL